MSSFSDLNLNVTNQSKRSIDELVEHAIKSFELLIQVGYDNLALTVTFEFPNAPTTAEAKGKKSGGGQTDKGRVVIPEATKYELPARLESLLKIYGRKIVIYSRLNVKVKQNDMNSKMHHLSYDIISLEPEDNRVLLYLCTNNFNADILSISSGIDCGLTDKHLIRPLRNAVSALSMSFEINYSGALASSIERRDMIMLGRCLTFNTKSKGLIISSGATQKIHLRAPYELINVTKLFDISDRDSQKLVRLNPDKVVMNSFCRKHTDTGMVYFNDLSHLKRLESALIALKRKSAELDAIKEEEGAKSQETEQMEVESKSVEGSPTKKIKS